MKPSNAEFTAFVGLDWADAKHDICVQAAGCEERQFDRFAHRTEHIEQWARSMQQRFGGRIAVALELSKGPIVYALQKYDLFVLFPINPSTLAKYRQAFKPSRAKDDPSDAELALDLLLRHRDKFQPLKPQSVPMRKLCLLVEQRRRWVGDKTRCVNRLVNTLKQYSPNPCVVRTTRYGVVLRLHYPLAHTGSGQTCAQNHVGYFLQDPQRALRTSH